MFNPLIYKKSHRIFYNIGRVKLSQYNNYEKKRFSKFKAFTALTLISSGGLIAYAYYDKDGRKQMEKVPFTKDVFDYLLGKEGETDKKGILILYTQQLNDFVQRNWKEVKHTFSQQKSIVEKKTDNMLDSIIDKFKPQKKSHNEHLLEDTNINKNSETNTNVAIKKNAPSYVKAFEKNQVNMIEKVSFAIQSINELIHHIKDQANLLKDLMESPDLQVEEENNTWKKLTSLEDQKADKVRVKDMAYAAARAELENMENLIEKLKHDTDTLSQKDLVQHELSVKEAFNNLNMANTKLREAESKSRIFLNYKWLLDEAKKQFKKEIESISPQTKLGTWTLLGSDFSKDELDTLLVHAHKKLNLVQRELAKTKAQNMEQVDKELRDQETLLTDRFNRQLASVIKDEQSKWSRDKQQELEGMKLEFAKRFESDLRREIAVYREQMSQYLVAQREELMRLNENQIQDVIKGEQYKYDVERTHVVEQMKDVEQMFKDSLSFRLDFVKMQRFWLMCQNLLQSIDHSEQPEEPLAGLQAFTKYPSLFSNTCNLPENAVEREMIQVILGSLATSTVDLDGEPFQSLEQLERRFPKVKSLCRRVAMIRDPNSSLFRYFVSYLQSFFVTDSLPLIVRHELMAGGDEEDTNLKGDIIDFGDKDFSDTFNILSLATHYLEQERDVESVVRLLNLLRGQPRIVASGWVRDAVKYLEVKQNLQILSSFALANALSNLNKTLTPHEAKISK